MAGYTTPGWTNGSSPAIDATALTNIGQAIEAAEHPFGTCSTAAATAAKAVTVDAPIASTGLFAGLTVCVKFSNGNSSDNPTLNVNSTGAKDIMSYGATPATTWQAGQVITFVYDGTNWVIAGFDAYTKEQSLSSATAEAIGTATGTTPDTPDEAFNLLASANIHFASGSYVGDGTTTKSLTFPFQPKLVVVWNADTYGLIPYWGGVSSPGWFESFIWVEGQDGTKVYAAGLSNNSVGFTQSGNTLSWRCGYSSSCLNYKDSQNGRPSNYRYFAIG